MPVIDATVRRGRRRAAVAAAAGVVALLAGCAGDRGHAAGPDRTVRAFAQAMAAENGTAACALLAPKAREDVEKSAEKPCAEAIGDEKLPADAAVTASEVWGDRAMVRTASDTVFVVRAGVEWLVYAAGCRPQGQDRPYDCQLEGT